VSNTHNGELGLSSSPAVVVRECELSADDLLSALLQLAPEHRVQILDSGGARSDGARFLIAGFDPFETIEARGDELLIERRDRGCRTRRARLATLAS
jgi:hypothetical protein